jgi:thiamine biosynthesis protein ThiC
MVVMVVPGLFVVILVALGALHYHDSGKDPEMDLETVMILRHLRQKTDRLMHVAAPAYPNLAANVRDVQQFPPDDMVDNVRKTVRRGKYDRATKTIYISTVSHTGRPLPPGVMNGIIAHELAHAASVSNHQDEWRATYLAMLHLATNVLGWDVLLECSACGMYGVCDPVMQCARCTRKTCVSTTATTATPAATATPRPLRSTE